jgi:hypothetical protein
MRRLALCAVAIVVLDAPALHANGPQGFSNPAIDSAGYVQAVADATRHRESRRVSEDEFIRLAKLPGTVIFDARSRAMYDALHVRGAININFADITVQSLEQAVPDKSTLILIYCNNNFLDAPEPFAVKLRAAALNLATYTSLYTYGYRNVYELGPLLSVRTTRIPFESTNR